jgi:hypothetical protein
MMRMEPMMRDVPPEIWRRRLHFRNDNDVMSQRLVQGVG